MKKALTIALAGVALAATLTFVGAGSRAVETERVASANALSPDDIVAGVLQIGLNPIGRPLRRGHYYVLHAYDARGVEVRVLADAQLGDILSVVPALNATVTPPYDRGPRIIHVPQLRERDDGAAPDDGDESAVSNENDDVEPAAAPPPRRIVPRSSKRSDAPPAQPRRKFSVSPPPVQKRAVLSAPPMDTSLTPIRPTPRFKVPVETGEKFTPPKDPMLGPDVPPVGYTPPAAAPDTQPAAAASDNQSTVEQ